MDIILTVIMEYFWDLHFWLLCVTFVYNFWYLQLCLFYFCLSWATILTVINNEISLLVFALFVCIVCHYCLSGAIILTLINYGIFVLVFALIVCIVFYYCLSRVTILNVINYGICLLVLVVFVCIVSCFSRSGWVHVFPLSVLYVFLLVY